MYNEYFGLTQAPFRITPDTALFYTGGGRGDVLDALVYAITSGEGIVKVVGEVGTGKTMLCRMLEERLPDNVQIAYLANPSLTPEDILHAVALELELDVNGDANRLQVMHHLQETLLARHANNQRVVVLVEEAQSMPVDTLEEIRLLSNLETKNEKLLQIVLFGQPELDDNLSKPEIRQLRERITHSFALTPLGREEIKDYVAFRLRASGYRGRDAFTSDAYRTMSRASEGLTRRVNIIADKAMLAAFADDTHDVSAKHVKSAIADSEFNASNRSKRRSPLFALGAGACLAVIVGAAVGWYVGNQAGSAQQSPLPSAPVATAPVVEQEQSLASRADAPVNDEGAAVGAQPIAATPASEPAAAAQAPVATPVTVASSDSGGVLADASPAQDGQNSRTQKAPMGKADTPSPAIRESVNRVVAATAPVVGAVATSKADEATQQASEAAARPLPAASVAEVVPLAKEPNVAAVATRNAGERAKSAVDARSSASAVNADQMQTATAAASEAPATAVKMTAQSGGDIAARPKTAPDVALAAKPMSDSTTASTAGVASESADAVRPKDSSLLQWRLGQTRQWLQRVDKNRYSIQLLATDAGQRNNLEVFLARRKRAGQIGSIFVYTTRIHSREWYGVLFGEFENYSQAREALRKLPPALLRHKPFIRNIKDINALG
jgi:type II secretory pathway predicted ATPase ExeA